MQRHDAAGTDLTKVCMCSYNSFLLEEIVTLRQMDQNHKNVIYKNYLNK